MDQQTAFLRQLAGNFASAWRAVGAKGDSDVPLSRLVARYGEPHRHYHTLRHVAAVLDRLHEHAGELVRPEEAALSVWFHDAVYQPTRGDNEVCSAELAMACLRDAQVPAEVVARIHAMILDTSHTEPAMSPDGAYVADADLAILAARVIAFDAYDASIRREYAAVPEAAYRAGRRHILQGFLDRPFIYQTAAFRKQYETAARANLGRALLRVSPLRHSRESGNP